MHDIGLHTAYGIGCGKPGVHQKSGGNDKKYCFPYRPPTYLKKPALYHRQLIFSRQKPFRKQERIGEQAGHKDSKQVSTDANEGIDGKVTPPGIPSFMAFRGFVRQVSIAGNYFRLALDESRDTAYMMGHSVPLFTQPVRIEQYPEPAKPGKGDGSKQLGGVVCIPRTRHWRSSADQSFQKRWHCVQDLRLKACPEQPYNRNNGHHLHKPLYQGVYNTAREDCHKKDSNRDIAPKQCLTPRTPSGREVCQRRHRRSAGGGEGPEPEKRECHQYPEKDAESPVQADKSVENTLTGKECVAANFYGNGVLQQAGRNQEEKKGKPVFGDNIRPPDQFAAALRKRHPNNARPKRRPPSGKP